VLVDNLDTFPHVDKGISWCILIVAIATQLLLLGGNTKSQTEQTKYKHIGSILYMSYQVNYLLEQKRKIFVNDKGEEIPYTSITMSGYVAGEYIEVGLKVSQADRKLIGLLINASEDVNIHAAKAGEDILPVRKSSPVEEETAASWLEDES
jgi:hypothetical protein